MYSKIEDQTLLDLHCKSNLTLPPGETSYLLCIQEKNKIIWTANRKTYSFLFHIFKRFL